jgi:hypothetical protein
MCRCAQAGPVRLLQPSTTLAALTFRLAKNGPAFSSPRRLPPSRRRQTVSRATICSRIVAPLYRGANPRMTEDTSPSRLSSSVAERHRIEPAPRRAREISSFLSPCFGLRHYKSLCRRPERRESLRFQSVAAITVIDLHRRREPRLARRLAVSGSHARVRRHRSRRRRSGNQLTLPAILSVPDAGSLSTSGQTYRVRKMTPEA